MIPPNNPHKQKVLHVPKNTVGRDFFVADVHGCFSLLLLGMAEAGFSPQKDRLFLGGDMIDRGPESHLLCNVLRQPYVYAVPGNHEILLANSLRDGVLTPATRHLLATKNYNGMHWLSGVTESELEDMVEAIEHLPLVIEVETDRGLVGLVHADVPAHMNWQTFKDHIRLGDPYTQGMAIGIPAEEHHKPRHRVTKKDKRGVEGIGRVFVGHTTQFSGILQLGNLFAIDTGAAWRATGHSKGHLSLVNPLLESKHLTQEPNLLGYGGLQLDLKVHGEIPGFEFSDLFIQEQITSFQKPRM